MTGAGNKPEAASGVSLFADRSLPIGMTPPNCTAYPAHSHDEWEFLYYFEGRGVLRVGDAEIPFHPGLIVCQPPNIPHSELGDGCFRNYYVRVNGYAPPISGSASFEDDPDGDFGALISMAFRLYYQDAAKNRSLVGHLLCCMRDLIDLRCVEENGVPSAIDRVKRSVALNFTNPDFDLNSVIAETRYNPDYFRRYFRESLGVTPHRYLLNLRLNYARRMLEDAHCSLTVREAAQLSGFSDCFYFSRLYKKYQGTTPKRTEKIIKGEKI